ncbi:MAG: hypothetical protein ABIY50_13855 [Ignavibacteria bacterium]
MDSDNFGAFTELNNAEDRQFATTPVPGNTAVLEYNEPLMPQDNVA